MQSLIIPPTIQTALDKGAHLILSCSGGKDSDAMAYTLADYHHQNQLTGGLVMVHADLGRSEWRETPAYVSQLAKKLDVDLHVVKHHKFDSVVDGIYDRMAKRPDVPPFPSSAARWCTSDFKRNPISKWIRNQYPENATVICAMGLRADESSARAKKPILQLRPSTQAPTKNRIVYNWNPIHHWSSEDVWDCIQHYADGVAHPAYELGNDRLSCAMCVLGCRGDLRNGAYNRPAVFREMVQIEIDTGYTFQQGKPLYEVAPDLLSYEQLDALTAVA